MLLPVPEVRRVWVNPEVETLSDHGLQSVRRQTGLAVLILLGADRHDVSRAIDPDQARMRRVSDCVHGGTGVRDRQPAPALGFHLEIDVRQHRRVGAGARGVGDVERRGPDAGGQIGNQQPATRAAGRLKARGGERLRRQHQVGLV
jgi:hypothetical protein